MASTRLWVPLGLMATVCLRVVYPRLITTILYDPAGTVILKKPRLLVADDTTTRPRWYILTDAPRVPLPLVALLM